ncbi:glycosyltransferase family 4 protein [Microbacterium laevaniformans]|uniref:glycosyltransferase family 4 protein n=1 Tax=Microbacterium laevaniformans TaxID=36807 RepID=UPI003D9557CB
MPSFLTEAAFGLRRGRHLIHYVGDTNSGLSASVPTVVTVHGVASRWITTARNPLQERIWRWRVARAIESASAVVTVSESSRADISEVFGVDPDQIHVIPHGLDHMVLESTEESRLPDLPASFALYLGNIEPRKNIVELVRAFDLPEMKGTGVPLVVAGRPAWNYEESMQAIEESANVIYVGAVSDSDRERLMRRAQVFVFPSLYEGFGFPILEAMRLGTPVVTSKNGSLRDLSGPSKVVSDSSAEAIAATLSDALSDTGWLEASRVSGPDWASQFSWRDSASAHAAVYESVMRR